MRKFLLSLALALLAGQTASATPVLFLETGFTTTTVVGSGPNVTFSNPNFGGWNITNISGSSDSPTTNNPFGLNLTSVSVICTVSGCDTHPLDVWLSDTTFTAQNTAFESTYQGSVAAISGGPFTEQMAWVGPGNILFQSNGSDGRPGGGAAIGTVGPFLNNQSPFDSSRTGGPAAGPSPYSLTIEDIFVGSSADVTFNADGQVRTPVVPEPSSLVLLGGGVLLLGALRPRHRRKV